ncbi:MAG: pyrroline-5-carboxylate reductase [Thermosediminibacterales bacterium]|nr:pyrroline-5-carboxylate reductase [Thermosediminibacterales bacterium]MDK2836307.1 pyrroline-5-carboxylate reductase [Thermosediminibacterales bacterium]
MLKNKIIGFIGAGSMAEAIIGGLLTSEKIKPENIIITNRNNVERLHKLNEKWGIDITRDKFEVIEKSNVVILAVKPQDIKGLLEEIGQYIKSSQVVVSVAAGISTSFIESFLTEKAAVVRSMPNTSCMIKESATALCGGKWADREHIDIAKQIFSAVGRVVTVNEEDMDAVTGLSGSGPAYVYLMIEALIDAGVQAGLNKDVSKELAIQTVLGAAKMAAESGEEPVVLRNKVTSPGGTTMAGLSVLNKLGFKDSLVKAVAAAKKRSKELGNEN